MIEDTAGILASLYLCFCPLESPHLLRRFYHLQQHYFIPCHIVCYIGNLDNIFLDFQQKKGYNEERKYPRKDRILHTEVKISVGNLPNQRSVLDGS